MFFIYSHNEKSSGASELARELLARRIKHENSSFIGSPDRIVINWGSQTVNSQIAKCKILNTTDAVRSASNKLSFFKMVSRVSEDKRPRIPNFTANSDEAKEWVFNGKTVVARTILNGSSGDGIKFMEDDDPESFVEAPLYVEYVKKKDEFRVHFVKDEIVDFQRKAVRPGYNHTNINWKVRNLQNGFIFVRENVSLPADAVEQVKRTIACCGLDFGAIDIIWNDASSKAYVLEVNTAPGLQGTTITSYANAFRKHYGEK